MPAPSLDLVTGQAPLTLTADEALDNAIKLRDRVLAEAPATEERRYYSEELHLEFVRAGFYHMFRPKMFGGYEFRPWEFFRVMREISRGDMSTGWSLTYAAGHAHQVASYFPESVQRAVFGEGHFAATFTGKPSGTATKVEGGWLIDAVAPFSSGCAYSTHFIGKCFVHGAADTDPVLSQYIVPRAAVTIRDDWGATLGMKGSSSHTVEITQAFVPEDWVMVGMNISEDSVSDGTPGWNLHGNSLYGGPARPFFTFEPAAISIGGAEAALDELTAALPGRSTAREAQKRSQHPRYQIWYADAVSDIAAADAVLKRSCELWDECAERSTSGGAPFTRLEELYIGRLAKKGQMIALTAVQEKIIRGLGTSTVISGSRGERIWRDWSTLYTHIATVNNEFNGMAYADGVLNGENMIPKFLS
ncbi:acyl-CoA dehydrogenase family protein [Nocardia asteroides]|uniref:acyl-CoA dehydrogenase family protein n=1 Tax=Nocardia asteroides TaxID=1824 RepID=UPI00342DDFD0